MSRRDFDPQCPDGYRFLIQLTDARSEQDARDTLLTLYGFWKAHRAIIIEGTRKVKHGFNLLDNYSYGHGGYRAYVRRD
jgi:hypothetical protein